MSILGQLEIPRFKATKSDKQLMNYIKSNIEEVIYKSISEIAKESEIGEATITRFTKKIGFSGFQDFKVTLAREISTSGRKRILNNDITNDESARDTALKILQCNIDVLERTVEITNFDEVQKCAKYIKKAGRVYFIGIGYSGIVAQDSNYKFMRVGVNSNSYIDSHNMVIMASIIDKDDLIIAISHSGETEEVIQAGILAKENGANVISITQKSPSRLKDISDINLSYISVETIFETGAVTTKLAQIFLIDLIYSQLVKERYSEAMERKIKTTEAIKKLNGK